MRTKRILMTLLVLFSLHLFYKHLGFYRDLHRRPCSIHSWAQCERASIALNYYEEGMNFFLPKIHKELAGEGITGLEFPFVNYSAAILYKIFGFKEIYYRVFVLFTLIIGLICFAQLVYMRTKNYWLALAAVSSAYLSPVLVYYSANFLPDTTSLGFALAAWYFFFRYLDTQSKKHFFLFFGFALFAAWIKISSLIVIGVVIALLILDYMKFFHKVRDNKPLFTQKTRIIIASAITAALVIAWYRYAQWLSERYGSDAFLLKQNLVTSKKEALEIWRYIQAEWVPQYYANETYTLIGCVLLSFLIGAKYVSRLLFTITLFTVLGSCCFVYLMFFQFHNHDYYIITLLPCVFLLLLTFVDYISRLADNYFPPLKFVVLIIFFFNSKECVEWCKLNYTTRYSAYMFAMTGDFSVYEDLEPKLRKLGVQKHETTVSAWDFTYCNSLYLMNQMGWSFNYDVGKDYIAWIMHNKNPKYLVLGDSAGFNKLYPNNFGDKIIGSHRGLLIYKLR